MRETVNDSTENNDVYGANSRRQALMRICSKATIAELENALAGFEEAATAKDMRAPEEGLIMLRGRIGGTGAPFNVGEATVTRAVIRLDNGVLGYSYLLGRNPERARLAAIIDALGQDDGMRERLQTALVEPVRARDQSEKQKERERTEATRVNFFTLVRGED